MSVRKEGRLLGGGLFSRLLGFLTIQKIEIDLPTYLYCVQEQHVRAY